MPTNNATEPQSPTAGRFTTAAILQGARCSLAIAVSVFAYGLVFGVLARQASLSALDSLLMSGLVFAGAAQFVVLDMWTHPLPVAAIVVTTLAVNLRHLLMGASLQPWLRGLPPGRAYGSLFFLCDESWALTLTELSAGKTNAAFLLGSGGLVYLAWLLATALGRLLGEAFTNPAALGLDFAFTAVFTALLCGLWKGRRDLLPWAVAALVSILAAKFLPGKWYIIIGGLAGSLAGAFRHERDS